MRATTTVDTFQARAKNEDPVSSLRGSDNNMTIEKWRIAKRPSREALIYMSTSKWPYFTEGLQLVQVHLLASARGVLGFKPHHHFYLSISQLSKGCIFTYKGSDAINDHPRKPVHERRGTQ